MLYVFQVYALSTQFYAALDQKGPKHVIAWTKNVELLCYEKILVPIHLLDHWTLAV